MRLAFTCKGRYTDFSDGYDIYCKRARKKDILDVKTYNRIIRKYCEHLSDKLCIDGIIDLPCELGYIAAATLTRRPRYIGKTFIGYGKYDWKEKQYDGKLKTFGIVYLPQHGKNDNLRCYGFVANRRLFKKIKGMIDSGRTEWIPVEFNDSMI